MTTALPTVCPKCRNRTFAPTGKSYTFIPNFEGEEPLIDIAQYREWACSFIGTDLATGEVKPCGQIGGRKLDGSATKDPRYSARATV